MPKPTHGPGLPSERRLPARGVRLVESPSPDLPIALDQALDALPIGVTITDLEGRIVHTNTADAAMHGHAVQDLIGQAGAVFAPPDRARPLAPDQLEQVQQWTRETVNIRRDGSRFTARLRSDVIRDADGRPLGMITTCEDITEAAEREQALRQREAQYRSMFERAALGLVVATPAGRIVDANPAVARMLGHDSVDGARQLVLPHEVFVDEEAFHALVRELSDGRPRTGLEMQWRRKDGDTITVRVGGTAQLDATGRVEQLELLVEDVTGQGDLRAQLRESQKMELLGQWTGGIAHDFNNILTVILANAEILNAVVPSDIMDVQEDLEELRGAARRGTAIVRKLLSFGRRREITLHPVALVPVVDDLLATLRRIIPENITIDIGHESDLPLVFADEGVVEQILLNLATNARDAMPDGGHLTIRTEARALGARHRASHGWGKPGRYACVSIADTGIGMDDETRARIFEPFFTTKEPGAGTGLGMAMVYGLMKQHHGFVGVESAPGQGTTVTVFFPAAEVDAEAAAAAPGSARLRRGTETVLFVEDEEAIRRATRRFLERLGYRVLLAGDGADALEVLRQHRADVKAVITDLLMPKMTGVELYEEAAADGLAAKFLFVSGYTRDSDRARRAVATGVPFLNKPWTPTELATRLRDVLDGEAAASQ